LTSNELYANGDKVKVEYSVNGETSEKCLILFKVKKEEDFIRRHTLSISRIKI